MHGTLRSCFVWIALCTLGSALGACGLGQSDDTDVSVQGNWSGSYTAAGSDASIPVTALVQKDGQIGRASCRGRV